MALGGKINHAIARKLHRAVSGKIGSLPDHVELLEVHGLVRKYQSDGITVADFDVFYVKRNGGEVAIHCPARGLEEWTVKIESTVDGRRSGKVRAQIGVP